MNSPVYYIRKSLSAKISIWIVLFAMVIFSLTLGYLSWVFVKSVKQEAINRATQALHNTTLRVNNILTQVETATDNVDWFVTRHLKDPDYMYFCAEHILERNSFVDGCSISFEPYYFKDKGKFYSIYAHRVNGQIESYQEGEDGFNYFCMDWYLGPKLLDRPCWTEPFFADPEDPNSNIIASYCKPLRDTEGNFVGSISVDISLEWLSRTIEAIKPYPNSYAIMIGEGGTLYIHPGEQNSFSASIFTKTLIEPNPDLSELGHAMLRGETGMREMAAMDEDCFVFYEPLGETGWSVALFCPKDDIFAGFMQFQITILIIVLLGLLLMRLFIVLIIAGELRPLRRLAAQTDTIAKGNFNQTLPDFDRIDEIGQLSHSFTDMQQALINYIQELKSSTAAKAALENELQVATDIQMSMLPRVFPPFPERKDIDLYASMTPAKEVGGDLYNYLLREGCLYFAVGDVSGKGVPAALFMAQATRLFRTLAGEGLCPAEIATRMNSGLCEGNDTMMFVTMFIGVIHLDSGLMEYCNCGHNPPMLGGEFIQLKHKNRPLGLFDDMPFQCENIPDIRGKQLLVYTDGLNEAMNPEHEQFGDERIIEILAQCKELTACQVVEKLREAIEQHRNGAEPNDDLTLLCMTISADGPVDDSKRTNQ